MNSEVLRVLTPADKPTYRRLMAQAFERGRVPNENDTIWDESFGSEIAGIWKGEHLRAAVAVQPLTVHWRGAVGGTLPLGGIAGVATSIEARGRRYVDRLLRDALVRMRDAGQVVSALYPFAWAFYRKFGWEWVGEKRSLTLPLREIKATPEGRLVREITGDAAKEIIAPVYDRYAARYHGAFTSVSHQWNEKLRHDDGRTTFVYAYYPDGGEPTAYLLWRYDSGSSDGGEIREFVATTPDGYRALFGLLHNVGTQCATARLTAPADAPLWSHLYHWGVKTQVEPTFQARVVDVAAALGKLARPDDLRAGASVSVRVEDEAAPWNDGTFHVSVDEERVLCSPALDLGTADLTLDIQAFSQAFWGMPALLQLRDAGRIDVANETGYETLSRLLPAVPVWTMDYF